MALQIISRVSRPQRLKPRGLSLALRRGRIRDDRLYDSSLYLSCLYLLCKPSSIFRAIHVGMIGMPAAHTQELILRLPVGLRDMSASKTALTSIARIDDPNLDTVQFGFVLNESPKLTERPIAVPGSVLAALNPGPRTNVRQVF